MFVFIINKEYLILVSNCNVYLVLVGYIAEDINNLVLDRVINYII